MHPCRAATTRRTSRRRSGWRGCSSAGLGSSGVGLVVQLSGQARGGGGGRDRHPFLCCAVHSSHCPVWSSNLVPSPPPLHVLPKSRALRSPAPVAAMETLPAELSATVFRLLPTADVVRAGGVSPAWRAAAHSPALHGPRLELKPVLAAPRCAPPRRRGGCAPAAAALVPPGWAPVGNGEGRERVRCAPRADRRPDVEA